MMIAVHGMKPGLPQQGHGGKRLRTTVAKIANREYPIDIGLKSGLLESRPEKGGSAVEITDDEIPPSGVHLKSLK
jgi:hypothetical protein